MWIATFRLHPAILHLEIRSTVFESSYKAGCSAVIGWHSPAVIGAIPRRRDHGVFRRRVPFYQRPCQRRCRSRIAKTVKRPQPPRTHGANTCSNRRPSEFRFKIHILFDTAVLRDPDGCLTSIVYRKPTH